MLDRILQSRLAEFVDRDEEVARFCSMLEDSNKPIMIVWGEAGIGKTSLLARMIHECAIRGLQKSEIVWKDHNPPDYMTIMRKMRDDLGVKNFNGFTDLVEYYTNEGYQPKFRIDLTVGSSQSVLQDASIKDTRFEGDVGGIIIKDSMFVLPRSDLAVPEAEQREKLTARFVECLSHFDKRQRIVVFMDAVEKMSADTEKWLWQDMFDQVMQAGFSHIKFVLCGRNPPPVDRDWKLFVESAALKPLGPIDIARYLKNRQIDLDEKGLQAVAFMVLTNSRGIPAEVATQVDMLQQMMRSHQGGYQ